MISAYLAIVHLTIRYGAGVAPAVTDLTMEVEPGEMLALVGPSGSGKSSTLRSIAGFVTPERGAIALDGADILGLPPERRGTALVFQQPALFPHLTVAGNVAFGLRMRGIGRAERLSQAETMLAAVQLEGYGDRRPHQLSGGQRQRVALARALVTGPRLLLLDEPFASLDPELRDDMRALVAQLQRRECVTTLLVTHDQQEAALLADRVALMLDGCLQQIAAPETLYTRPANLAVARFFGARNFLPGILDGDGRTVATALGPLRPPENSLAPGPVTLIIRPEHIRLDEPDHAALAGQVRQRHYLGALYRYTVAVGPLLLTVTTPDASFRPGDEIGVSLPAEHLWAVPESATGD